jgi:hypothetical protein
LDDGAGLLHVSLSAEYYKATGARRSTDKILRYLLPGLMKSHIVYVRIANNPGIWRQQYLPVQIIKADVLKRRK